MESKIIEVRDRGTRKIVLALKLRHLNHWEEVALARAGYGIDDASRDWYVILLPIDGGVEEASIDPWYWSDNRTLHTVHRWLRDHTGYWESLPFEGALIDVEYLLGETEAPKQSEILPG